MGVHATAVTASQSMLAGQLSVHTMASCYNCCAHSLLDPQYLLYLIQKKILTKICFFHWAFTTHWQGHWPTFGLQAIIV